MPGKTHADRLLELEQVVPSVKKQVEFTEKATDALGQTHREIAETVNALRLEYVETIVLLKKEVEDLKNGRKSRNGSQKCGPDGCGRLDQTPLERISVVLATLVAYMIAKR